MANVPCSVGPHRSYVSHSLLPDEQNFGQVIQKKDKVSDHLPMYSKWNQQPLLVEPRTALTEWRKEGRKDASLSNFPTPSNCGLNIFPGECDYCHLGWLLGP